MSEVFDIMNAHMSAVQDRWPDSFTFPNVDGDVIACTAVSLSEEETKELQGLFKESYNNVIQVQKSRFPGEVATEEDKILYDGETMRILKVFKASNGLALRFVLGDEYAE